MGFWAAVVLGGLALALTVSGLFSVLSYVVEQQAKEIGVRMALGAATRNVVRLILSQSVRPVGLGLAAGVGLAATVAIVLMTTPIAAEISGDIDVFDPVAYAASLMVIVTCVRAGRVRSRPPRRSHRSDRDPQNGVSDGRLLVVQPLRLPDAGQEPIADARGVLAIAGQVRREEPVLDHDAQEPEDHDHAARQKRPPRAERQRHRRPERATCRRSRDAARARTDRCR